MLYSLSCSSSVVLNKIDTIALKCIFKFLSYFLGKDHSFAKCFIRSLKNIGAVIFRENKCMTKVCRTIVQYYVKHIIFID